MHKMPCIQVLEFMTLFYLLSEISERNILSLARFEIFTALLLKMVSKI
jgi:hypothetical protein